MLPKKISRQPFNHEKGALVKIICTEARCRALVEWRIISVVCNSSSSRIGNNWFWAKIVKVIFIYFYLKKSSPFFLIFTSYFFSSSKYTYIMKRMLISRAKYSIKFLSKYKLNMGKLIFIHKDIHSCDGKIFCHERKLKKKKRKLREIFQR